MTFHAQVGNTDCLRVRYLLIAHIGYVCIINLQITHVGSRQISMYSLSFNFIQYEVNFASHLYILRRTCCFHRFSTYSTVPVVIPT